MRLFATFSRLSSSFFFPSRYLNRSLTEGSGLRRQDGGGVAASVASNSHGRDLAFDFVRDNWDKYLE